MKKKPDTLRVLEDLKDFQRATVDYVSRRLFHDHEMARRFLVADEVGLGKTMVARGVIAKCVDHLWGKVKRINIVYICSNEDIAAQNLDRLKIPDCEITAQSTRLTLLPLNLQHLKKSGVNLIALTPGTTFDKGRSGGRWDERVLLFWLLQRAWGIKPTQSTLHFFRQGKGFESFAEEVRNSSLKREIDAKLSKKFVQALEKRAREGEPDEGADLRSQFEELRKKFRGARLDDATRQARSRWLGKMSRILAQTCIKEIEPDLVILDEFQRFKHLLKEDNDAGELARELFDSEAGLGARVLLLSATPYRSLTLNHEEDADHHSEFIGLLKFLENTGDSFDLPEVATYRDALLHAALPDGRERLMDAKRKLEARLCRVMSRTEKSTPQSGDGNMVVVAESALRLDKIDLRAYLGAQEIADVLGEGDMVEYWKSAPFLFNFMDDYALKRAFKNQLLDKELLQAVRKAKAAILDVESVESFRKIPIPNPRLRALSERTIGREMWRLLWIPPAMPYHKLAGAFSGRDTESVTKQLVFSAWHVVPKSVAAILSHEAEREMIRAKRPRAEISQEEWREHSRLLRFNLSGEKPQSMPLLSLVYPCEVLARECDPLMVARDGTLSAAGVKRRFAKRIRELVAELGLASDSSGPADQRWYWLVPMLLDQREHPEVLDAWWNHPWFFKSWVGKSGVETEQAWRRHIEMARQTLDEVASGRCRLGQKPAQLFDVLAFAAAAGPATTVLRSFGRHGSAGPLEHDAVRQVATKVAFAFLRLFGHPEVSDMIRSQEHAGPYWKQVLVYAHGGCLQAVIDEYIHLLSSAGLDREYSVEEIEKVGRQIIDAAGLQAAANKFDAIDVRPYSKQVRMQSHSARLRFAMRFGNEQQNDEESAKSATGKSRKERVRAAFNSPFWPFVLTTTSAGQEGLDFHYYCHAVTHWNLPANPVDLEQREGRVHRYMGHAIRINVAMKFAKRALRSNSANPWSEVFRLAMLGRQKKSSDLVPFWIFDGPAKIERHIPSLPHSRDVARMEELREALAIYRMVFGQNRQEDLMEFLLDEVPEAAREELVKDLQIDLRPPSEKPHKAGKMAVKEGK